MAVITGRRLAANAVSPSCRQNRLQVIISAFKRFQTSTHTSHDALHIFKLVEEPKNSDIRATDENKLALLHA